MSRAIAMVCGIVLMAAVGWATHQRSDQGKAKAAPREIARPVRPGTLEVLPCGDEAKTRAIATEVLALPARTELELQCWTLREHGRTRYAIAFALPGKRGAEGHLILANEARAVETRRALGLAPAWSFELLQDERARPGEVQAIVAAKAGDKEVVFDALTLAELDGATLARP